LGAAVLVKLISWVPSDVLTVVVGRQGYLQIECLGAVNCWCPAMWYAVLLYKSCPAFLCCACWEQPGNGLGVEWGRSNWERGRTGLGM